MHCMKRATEKPSIQHTIYSPAQASKCETANELFDDDYMGMNGDALNLWEMVHIVIAFTRLGSAHEHGLQQYSVSIM